MKLEKLYNKLRNLRTYNGLYLASTGSHYQKVWVRDTFYCVLPELKSNPELYGKTFQTLLDYYINIEQKYNKISWLIKEPYPKAGYRYTHPRCTIELDEINQEWGFKQHDCIGELFYGIYLGEVNGIKIIRDEKDLEIINKLIKMLEALEFWRDADNGLWEENEEVHASSVGACLSGLHAIKKLGFKVSDYMLDCARIALDDLLPRESITKHTDLALLSLIYPFDIVSKDMAKKIIADVEEFLLRERGVARYCGDMYYNIANHSHDTTVNGRYHDYSENNAYGNEAEWCFGLAFLSLSCMMVGDFEKAELYAEKLENCIIDGEVPELYYARTNINNDNTPLGWSNAMTILTLENIEVYRNICMSIRRRF